LLYHKLITTKYYLTEDDKIKEIKIPHWQSISLFNSNFNSFYFLLNYRSFNNTYNTSFFGNYKNTNLQIYSNYNDFKKMLPVSINFNDNETSLLTDYLYIRNSSFIKFFINNMIDVPVCFKKSSSLKTRNFELPLLKFSNFLMKKGKKEKIIRLIFSSFRLFFKNTKNNNLKNSSFFFFWLNIYIFGLNFLNTLYFFIKIFFIFIFD